MKGLLYEDYNNVLCFELSKGLTNNMKIATIVFTYNRSLHTEKVLESLKNNTILPEKLYIFQDGLRQEEHCDEWKKVNRLIKNVHWSECEVSVQDENKGLAASIVSGINYVLNKYDAVIVLEDDCVTHPQFMEYMTQALEKYAGDSRVYCVNGYGWPADVNYNGTDAYFVGRVGSWGWGTWKNKWVEYEQDYKILSRIKKDKGLLERFHIWGEDLESYLLGNIEGRCDSWAVFWALKVIEKKGYCLCPYDSFVENIGFDGSGVHCAAEGLKQRLREKDNLQEISLPDNVGFEEESKSDYADFFSWTSKEVKLSCYNNILVKWVRLLEEGISIADNLLKRGIYKVSIWGRGKLCDLLLIELEHKVEILSIIESRPNTESYRNIPIVSTSEIPKETQLVIIIPTYDMDRIIKKGINTINCKVIGLDQLIKEFSV